MNITPHFKDITPEAYAILDELCALKLSHQVMDGTLRLIRQMTELGASDKQIWEAIVLFSKADLMQERHDPRLVNSVKVSSIANRDLFVERQLLRNPKKVTELITGKARFVFSCVATFNAKELAKNVSHLIPKATTSPAFDTWIEELYNDYAPWMKESCFWAAFDQSLQSMATTKLTISASDNKRFTTDSDRPVYLLAVPTNKSEAVTELLSWGILSQALGFGAEVAEIDGHIYFRAHAGDEDMFERWLSKKVADWKIEKKAFRFKVSEFDPKQTQWKFQRCNLFNIDGIYDRLCSRVNAMKYERFDVAPGEELASITEGCDDRLL